MMQKQQWKYIIAALSWKSNSLNLQTFRYLIGQTSPIDSLQKLISVCPCTKLRYDLIANPKIWEQSWQAVIWCWNKKISMTFPGQTDYPPGFFALKKPPLILTYLGEPSWLHTTCLSIVGSRLPSSAAIDWMEQELTSFINSHKVCIVSGGARGIDQESHKLAILAKRPTICFVPSGLNQLYPRTLYQWKDHILASGGALLSQFSPFEPMHKSHFHKRNWLIAAISPVTLVVEARRRSGTLITAKAALELGSQLAVLPCSPIQAKGLGGLDLLFDGAQLIRDAIDLGLLVEHESQSTHAIFKMQDTMN